MSTVVQPHELNDFTVVLQNQPTPFCLPTDGSDGQTDRH